MSIEAGHGLQCDIVRERLARARVPLHCGNGVLEGASGRLEAVVEFVLPVGGDPIVAVLVAHAEFLPFGSFDSLTASGVSADGEFQMRVPVMGFDAAVTSADGSRWALVGPANGPLTVSYAPVRRPTSVGVLLNNFERVENEPLTVSAAGHVVTFRQRADHDHVLALLESDLLTAGSLTALSFEAWSGASDEELIAFAYDVATACTFIAGQLTNLVVIELLDTDGRVMERVLPRPVESPFTNRTVIPYGQVPRFFEECFSTHQSMRRDTRWRKLSSYCGTVEACPTLEQKFMSVAIALEFVMRNALIDAGEPAAVVEKSDLGPLVGRVRRLLGWQIPGHYEPNDRWRLLRNAVAHGNERRETVTKDSGQFRQEFDKLKLLLNRLALLQLGYRGNVLAPGEGGSHESQVDDFSEDRNTFN